MSKPKNPLPRCSCHICHKETNNKGINTHFFRKHGTKEEKSNFKNSTSLPKHDIVCCIKCQKTIKLLSSFFKHNCLNKHQNCLYCGKETTNAKFCCNSCAAKYNNKNKKPRTIESKLKTSNSLKKIEN